MKQEVDGQLLGAVSFAATGDPFVAVMAHGVNEHGNCALLLDLEEVRTLMHELDNAAIRAFGADWQDRTRDRHR